MVVLGEDNYEDPPSIAYCKTYAKSMNVPLDRIFVDSGPLGGWDTLFSNVNPYIGADGMFSLPWDLVLDAQNMEYKFGAPNHGFPNVVKALQSLGIPIN